MIPENVTLVVKAPNQQIEDQNIECQSSWTVRQLKGHLANVYPSKPKSEEQKIIYSGQLLHDDCVLKDVLRRYGEDVAAPHTVHLVCAAPLPPLIAHKGVDRDGLRQRISAATITTAPTSERSEVNRPETRQNDQNHTVEMQNYLNSMGYGPGPGYLAAAAEPNMLAMHQAYLHYMQRYAHQWQETVAAAPAPPQPAQVPPAAPPPDDEERRDWLDHIYAASRLAILFSLVYLYGSPARLLLVVLLAAAGYLHQIGFFRDLQVNAQIQQEPARQQANVQNANVNANINNINANINNANANINNANGENASENTPNANVNIEQQTNDSQQSILAVTWMIFSSFFASLIPDTNV